MRKKLSDFNYELPKELVAEYPNKNRDEARLMVIDRKDYSIKHRQFKDMIEYFDENDVIVLNNTKVFPARLYGNKEKTGARIEVFLLRELNAEQRLWDVLVDPARKIRIEINFILEVIIILSLKLLIILHQEEEHYDFYVMLVMKILENY